MMIGWVELVGCVGPGFGALGCRGSTWLGLARVRWSTRPWRAVGHRALSRGLVVSWEASGARCARCRLLVRGAPVADRTGGHLRGVVVPATLWSRSVPVQSVGARMPGLAWRGARGTFDRPALPADAQGSIRPFWRPTHAQCLELGGARRRVVGATWPGRTLDARSPQVPGAGCWPEWWHNPRGDRLIVE